MSDRKRGIYLFTSPVERVQETAGCVISKIPGIGVSRAKILNLLAGPSFAPFQKILNEKVKEGRSVQDVCNAFWKNELEIKPEMVAKDYINTLGMIFRNSIRRNKKISIISFRHGDKDKDGNLSEDGKKQAKNLGKDLKNKINKKGDTILAATHNVINETVIRTIFSGKKLPEERNVLLNFTEKVTYTFFPNEQDSDKSYLQVNWRNKTKKISYKKFKEILEGKKEDEKIVEMNGE